MKLCIIAKQTNFAVVIMYFFFSLIYLIRQDPFKIRNELMMK